MDFRATLFRWSTIRSTATGEVTLVVVAAGDDDVGISHLVLDVGDIIFFDESVEPVEHALDVPAPFLDVPDDPTSEGQVEVQVDEYFEIEHVPDPGVVHGQNSLENYDGAWGQGLELSRLSRVLFEAINRGFGGFSVVKFGQTLVHFVEVEGVGVVEVVVVGVGVGEETGEATRGRNRPRKTR